MYKLLKGSRILLLQGPMGPFFWRLKLDLEVSGYDVHKVNFNGGDRHFYHDHQTIDYRESLEDWPFFLSGIIRDLKIEKIMLFGDNRPLHRAARKVAREMGVGLMVFEEGYLRPDYITLEPEGVNGYSKMPQQADAFREHSDDLYFQPKHIKSAFFSAAVYAARYHVACNLASFRYPEYHHHRSTNLIYESFAWVRSGYRKLKYKKENRHYLDRLTSKYSKNFFLVPLQVHNDSQLRRHSQYPSVHAFIQEVVSSFARRAPSDTRLVIKHHPMDRGYRDYSKLIKKLARQHNVKDRVIYVHDLHLPTLLKHACGTVVVNSTVGLSSIHHNTPVINLGKAIYDIPGLTYQGLLRDFWSHQGTVDRKLYQGFRYWLLNNTQFNGNFYRRIPGLDNSCGVQWEEPVDRPREKLETNFSLSKKMEV